MFEPSGWEFTDDAPLDFVIVAEPPGGPPDGDDAEDTPLEAVIGLKLPDDPLGWASAEDTPLDTELDVDPPGGPSV